MKKTYNFTIKTARFRALAVFSALAVLIIAGCNKEIDDDLGVGGPNYQTAIPTICPDPANPVPSGTPAHLATTTEGAEIYYTTSTTNDVEVPTTGSTPYSGAISITGDDGDVIIIKAIAVKSGLVDSPIATFEYTIDNNISVEPTANPDSGEVAPNTKITLTTPTEGASIYYTINGGEPTTASALYSDSDKPVIEGNDGEVKTIRAYSVKEGSADSVVATFTYTINDNAAASYAVAFDLGYTPETADSDSNLVGDGWDYNAASRVFTLRQNRDDYIAMGSTGEGALSNGNRIVVDPGVVARLKLLSAKIDLSQVETGAAGEGLGTPGPALDIGPGASLTLVLTGDADTATAEDNNVLKSGLGYAGVHAPGIFETASMFSAPYASPASLTVTSAQGGGAAAGVLVVEGGTGIDAEGKRGAGAGIGGNFEEPAGTLSFEGGSVDARGGDWAGAFESPAWMGGAGIGGGGCYYNFSQIGKFHGGAIVISGGVVNAESKGYAAGIGGGPGGACDIEISGGVVNAYSPSFGAAIGNGPYSAGGSVTIYGGTITAFTGDVTQYTGAAIGGGFHDILDGDYYNGCEISIRGGNVSARNSGLGAAIGGGASEEGLVAISGGFVCAVGEQKGAGIGGGFNAGGDISISDGIVIASGNDGAGIGGAMSGVNLLNISISGGMVIARTPGTWPDDAQGIGHGGGAFSSSIDLSGDPVIFATSIGTDCASMSGVDAGASVDLNAKTIALSQAITVPTGGVLTVPLGWTLNLAGSALGNNGEIRYGTVTGVSLTGTVVQDAALYGAIVN